jgi:general secretion pathway protein D
MVAAKGTTTTAMPDGTAMPEGTAPYGAEAQAPTRPLTIDEYIDRMMNEKDGATPVMVKADQPKVVPAAPAATAAGVEEAKYPDTAEVKPAPSQPDPPMATVEQPEQPAQPEQPVVAEQPEVAPEQPLSLDERRMIALEEEKRIQLQYEEYLVNYYIAQAEALKAELRFEEAEVWVLKALERAPDHQGAIALYREIQAAQGKRAGELPTAKGDLENLHNVRIQEALTKANYYFNRGKKAFHEERYAAAIDAFEDVQTVINQAPYGANWGSLPEETEQFIFQARNRKDLKDQMDARDAAKRALNKVKQEEDRRAAEEQERTDALLTEGIDAFENERFELAESLAEQVISLNPDNGRARDLLEQSVRARHSKTSSDLLQVTKERFREWKLDIEQAQVPWSNRPLNWPSQKEWDRITRRADAITEFGAADAEDPANQNLLNQLREEKVTFSFDEATLPQALDFIRTLKNINIVIDDKVKDDLEGAPVTLTVNELELDSALDLLLRLAGPTYTYILQQGVVFVTNAEGARGDAVLRVHAVGDLTIRLTNFTAPNLILQPAGAEVDEASPIFGKSEEGEQLIGGGAEDLMDMITQNVDPESWEGDNYKINVSGEDKLVVVHTPKVQAEIARLLDDLRRFAGLVVTIESRFLTVNDDFLQDVGVDIRGLGGEKGTLVNLDDVTNGLEDNASAGLDNGGPGLPVNAAGNPSAGAFFNDGSDGDYRGRTENLFDVSGIGRRLNNIGGAIIQYTFLDDTDVSMIMRAVEKTSHARFLQAPNLTVYNTQRANITLVNQLSFIQDFDVEVAQTAFIADPIVGIIQDGLTLDVRPTISHDRKYITLQLQPTVATLIRPIPTFQTSLGALTTPVTIQLPEMIIQKSQTTVRVPDGGSLVIGGLKNISLVDLQSEIPFLAEIPILSFFFSRQATSSEVENLMIIVTARITDLVEEEQRFRSPYVR